MSVTLDRPSPILESIRAETPVRLLEQKKCMNLEQRLLDVEAHSGYLCQHLGEINATTDRLQTTSWGEKTDFSYFADSNPNLRT